MAARVTSRQQRLIDRYIEEDPRRPGATEACLYLDDAYVPVWALAAHYHAVGDDIGQLAVDYEIPLEAAEAALLFYEQHRPVIDSRLEQNERLLRDHV